MIKKTVTPRQLAEKYYCTSKTVSEIKEELTKKGHSTKFIENVIRGLDKICEDRRRIVEEPTKEKTSSDEKTNKKDTKDSDKSSDKGGKGEFENIIDKLKSIKGYSQFVSALKKLSGDQKNLFMKYFGKVDAQKPDVSKTGIPATKLVPTQSEIDWKKSLSYGLGQDCSYFFEGTVTVGSPVLTYKGKYIIDGHHRWSQLYMFNPKGKVACTNFDYDQSSPIDVLKDFQATIFAKHGTIKVGTAGTNIWNVSEKELTKYINDNISEACWQSLVKAGVAEDQKSAVKYLVKNAMQLQKKVKPIPKAPDRVDMPQTDKNVINKAANSMTDMS